MSDQKYPLDLGESDPCLSRPFDLCLDPELDFEMFDHFTKHIKQKFETLSYPEPCQKQDVPVLCRGDRTSDTTQDMHLDQPPPYRLVESPVSKKDGERGLIEHSAFREGDERGPVEGSASRRDDKRSLVEDSASRKDDERRPVEDSAFRKDDARTVSPHIQVTPPPKKLRHWWRSLFGSRLKKPHGPPQPTAPFLEPHNHPQPTSPFLEPHDTPQPTKSLLELHDTVQPTASFLEPQDPPQPAASLLELHGPHQPRASSPDPPQYSPMPPEAQGPRRIYERTDRLRQESPIFKLPKPVMIQIMKSLAPVSLWSLRQASALFRTLFDDRQFSPFHDTAGLYDAHMNFSTDFMSQEERREARAMLQPKRRCTACTRVYLRGEFEPAMIKLRELRFCHACGEKHATIFFPHESIERGDENLVCIGRLGKWELCSHTEPIMWDSLKDVLPVPNIEKYGGCPHPVHQPRSEETSTKYSSFPRLHIIRWSSPTDSHTTIKIGWDLPLLDIDSRDPPSTAGIRSTLQQLIVGGALRNHKTCPHMADGKVLSDFISAAVCDCFRKPYCGALYTWALTSGRMTLIYRYSWSVFKPTSPAWLNLLDDLPTLAGIFHEKNKHIFWCDSPACATGRDLRPWQDMVKEEMGLHYERHKGNQEHGMQLSDWHSHVQRFWKVTTSNMRLPQRVISYEPPDLLHAVRVAAKGDFMNYGVP
ncbi:unnamed protein product [Clonostachys byssicola]|uniref:F-box domain-containing protein n=1 Tax=Clonostachys byssicola TaxID=160290 RepID=A0A9N9U866_9HYPO|nr:unnamed protein product [Clonostachys byssicola]